MKKIAIFADVQNIYYTTRQALGRQFNYRALWKMIASRGEIRQAYAYAIESTNIKQNQFQDTLREIGFEVKLKPYIQRKDGSAKGDWDVGIALDVIETASNIDEIILLSGDGDFDILAKRAQDRYQANVVVVSVKSLTAASLINAASGHIDIQQDLLM
jgi:uncharacterized LabA/DUF88 family protein